MQHAVAVLCVVVSTAIRIAVGHIWPDMPPFMTFYPTVLVAALTCGVLAGIEAAALSAVVAWWLFVPPTHQFFPLTPDRAAGLVLFCLSSGAIIWLAGWHRSIVLRLRAEQRKSAEQQEQMQTVMREVTHRAKNLLAIVTSIAAQTARQCNNFDEFSCAYAGRLQALAKSHDALVEQNWTGVPIQELVRTQLAPFRDADGVSVRTSGPDIIVNAKAAEQLGLCLHELATNATKYGALSVPTGTVTIEWVQAAGEFRVIWRERGGPRVEKPVRTGFGSLVLQRIAAQTLNGKAEKDFAPEGITWTLVCPAAQVAQQP